MPPAVWVSSSRRARQKYREPTRVSRGRVRRGRAYLSSTTQNPRPRRHRVPRQLRRGLGIPPEPQRPMEGRDPSEPPTNQPKLSGTDPPTEGQVVQWYGRFPGSSSGTSSVRPVRISKKAQALPSAARRKALHISAGRTYKTEAYTVLPSLKQDILAWAGVSRKEQHSMVDAFAKTCNAQVPRY